MVTVAACEILPDINAATEEDWATEYNDLILSIAIVDDMMRQLSILTSMDQVIQTV